MLSLLQNKNTKKKTNKQTQQTNNTKNTLKCFEGWSTTPPFATFTLCNQMTALRV